jgi:hypothetical protein
MKQIILQNETNKMIQNIIAIFKTNFLIFSSFILSFFAPVIPFIVITILFILLDTIMGLLKVKFTSENTGLKLNSNAFKRGFIPKMLIYTLVLISVYSADKILTNEIVKHYTQFNFVITKLIALILIVIEAWSIDENFKAICKKGYKHF